MTKIYANHQHKKGLIAPCKCGSSAFGNYLIQIQDDVVWEEYSVESDLPYAFQIIEHLKISDYEFVGITRDPVEWYVSGYRFIKKILQTDNDNNMKKEVEFWRYPNTFLEHLLLIEKIHMYNYEYDKYWLDHCFRNPTMHFPKNTKLLDLNNETAILNWLNQFWNTWHPFHIINKTETNYEYPILDYGSITLLKRLYKNYWHEPHLHNIDKSIKQYILTH